ncbi:MAG: tetratricopeptide repeat protein [Sulfuricella sp.]|nr:tetratricopeptide repeat protein [Sulfuricella sp.]
MSLLMEALKKAERAKQGHTIPHGQASAPGRDISGQTQQSGLALEIAPSFEPDFGLEPHIAPPDSNNAFPLIIAAHDLDLPDGLDPATPIKSGSNLAPDRTEPVTAAPELALDAYDLSPPDEGSAAESPGGAYDLPPPAENASKPTGSNSGRPALQTDAQDNTAPLHMTPQGPALRSMADQSADDGRAEARERSYAKSVFTAKQPANSRKLLIASISLGIAASVVGGSAYYWPVASSGFTALMSGQAPQTAMPAPQAAATVAPTPGSPDAQAKNVPIAITPEAEKEPAHTSQPNPPPITAAPASTRNELEPAGATDSTRASARSGSGSPEEKPAIRFRQNIAANQVNPTLSGAYQAFISGNIEVAQQQYHKILQQEPNNRDALLGLAAVALNRKQTGQAAAYYAKLLELDPSDPEALAGLIGSQGQIDPVQSESRLKKILAQNPQAGAIHFALGNLYSQQSRWAEAQQAYFRAYSSTPGNADYAFNLAISLEHLSQGKLALDYYQRALAQSGPASFDKLAVQRRIQELQQPAAN